MKKTAATRKAVTSLTALALAFLFGINSVIAFAAPAAAGPATTAIEVNGSQAPIQGYNLDGNNYFKLRDLAAAVDVGLEWDAASNTASIDTNGHYKPDPTQLITGLLPRGPGFRTSSTKTQTRTGMCASTSTTPPPSTTSETPCWPTRFCGLSLVHLSALRYDP